mmetsp:Transcript_6513/g.11918  ORF Transcript_6513/g.11918 Transcript_6513/m.11918 type:complete len:217 (+) Transcript_6513:1340-1990(+)
MNSFCLPIGSAKTAAMTTSAGVSLKRAAFSILSFFHPGSFAALDLVSSSLSAATSPTMSPTVLVPFFWASHGGSSSVAAFFVASSHSTKVEESIADTTITATACLMRPARFVILLALALFLPSCLSVHLLCFSITATTKVEGPSSKMSSSYPCATKNSTFTLHSLSLTLSLSRDGDAEMIFKLLCRRLLILLLCDHKSGAARKETKKRIDGFSTCR